MTHDIPPLVVRNAKGQMIKGSVANPKGRPKKEDVEKRLLEEAKKQELPDAFFKGLDKYTDDSEKMGYIIRYLTSNARTKDELFKYSKEFAPYYKSKLQSIETKTKEDRTITLRWEGSSIPLLDTAKVIDVNEIKEIGLNSDKESLISE